MAGSERERIERHTSRDRLRATARRLIDAPSPTGAAGPALNALAELLTAEGFAVERPAADHPAAPAVVARLDSGHPGRTLQFNAHLDTVHLPFAGFGESDGRLTGSGAADMKGGAAAAIEAVLALRDGALLEEGSVLLTAHDLHEAPWGFGQQLDRMIREDIVGDAVLIPEPLHAHLPIAGRGQACWSARLHRAEPPMHEVMRSDGLPDVLSAGATLALILRQLDEELAEEVHPVAGRSSAFVGQIHCGEIYNQSAAECRLEGTRRWVPGTNAAEVELRFRASLRAFAERSGLGLDLQFQLVRDAFHLDPSSTIVHLFQVAHAAFAGRELPTGPKPFVDDGNSFSALAGVPAITHGPEAGGQHTTSEWVILDDLERVARTYALTAALYCRGA